MEKAHVTEYRLATRSIATGSQGSPLVPQKSSMSSFRGLSFFIVVAARQHSVCRLLGNAYPRYITLTKSEE